MCRDNVPRARFASTVEPQATLERNENGDGFQVCTHCFLYLHNGI